MAYEFKYLKYEDGIPLKSGVLIERTDQVLFKLQEEKGKFHANCVEFLLKIKLGSTVSKDDKYMLTVRSVSKFMTAVLRDKYGDGSTEKLHELMADVDDTVKFVMGGD